MLIDYCSSIVENNTVPEFTCTHFYINKSKKWTLLELYDFISF